MVLGLFGYNERHVVHSTSYTVYQNTPLSDILPVENCLSARGICYAKSGQPVRTFRGVNRHAECRLRKGKWGWRTFGMMGVLPVAALNEGDARGALNHAF